MSLTQDELEALVKRTMDEFKKTNPSFVRHREQHERRNVLKSHGFTESPYGTKAIMPGDIMRAYEERMKAQHERRQKYINSKDETDE